MNTTLIKIAGYMSNLRKLILDQLWVIGILSPLAVLAILGLMRYSGQNKVEEIIHDDKKFIVAEASISTAELTRIVSMPLGELLEVRVYFDSDSSRLQSATVMISVFTLPVSHREKDSNLLLAYQSRRSSLGAATYLTYCKSKDNRAILEQT